MSRGTNPSRRNPIAVQVGKKLKALRVEEGLSARQLGKELGISHAHVIYIEQGKHSLTVDVLYRICQFFKRKPDWFFPGEKM